MKWKSLTLSVKYCSFLLMSPYLELSLSLSLNSFFQVCIREGIHSGVTRSFFMTQSICACPVWTSRSAVFILSFLITQDLSCAFISQRDCLLDTGLSCGSSPAHVLCILEPSWVPRILSARASHPPHSK